MPSCLFGEPLSHLYRPQAAHGMISTHIHTHGVYLERITCQAGSMCFWAAIQLRGSEEKSAPVLEPDVPPDKCPSSCDGVSHRHKEGETHEGERSRMPSAYAVHIHSQQAYRGHTALKTLMEHQCFLCTYFTTAHGSGAGLSSQPASQRSQSARLHTWRCARCGVRAPRRQAGRSTQVTSLQWRWHFTEKQLDPRDDR